MLGSRRGEVNVRKSHARIRTLRQEPADRWSSLLEVARKVAAIDRDTEGIDYPRHEPEFPARMRVAKIDRETIGSEVDRDTVGHDDSRPEPEAPNPNRGIDLTHDRRSSRGVHWDDPREW